MAFPYLGDFLSWIFGFHIPLPLPTFGLLVALAVFSAIWIVRIETDRVGIKNFNATDFGMFAALGGVVGARVFHILESPAEFLHDPIGMIFTRGGFSIYGGWVVGTVAGVWYLRRKKMPVWEVADITAMGMMLAYGVGRIGCQLSGDGDWGTIANMSLKPDWLPTWFWAQTYTGNVVGEVIPPPGVYPTPMYESAMAFLAFGLMWSLRKRRPHGTGWMFSFFMFLCGVQRLLIEQIRINPKYHLFGLQFTQAELLSVVFIVVGVAGMIWSRRRRS